MKLFISVDIEGIVGVATLAQLGPSGFEYAQARTWMTDTLLAVIEAATAAGVTSFVVADAHANAQNLLLDRLPDTVELVRSWPRPLAMMQGVDAPVPDAAMLIGYHCGNTSPAGGIAHVLGGHIREIRLNGRVASEAYLSAAIAGHFGVPIALITGDAPFVAETSEFLVGVEAAVVKDSYGMWSTRTVTPAVAHDRVHRATARAVGRLGDFRPLTLPLPITVELRLAERLTAELLGYLRDVEAVGDGHSVRFVASDMLEASRFIEFVNYFVPEAGGVA